MTSIDGLAPQPTASPDAAPSRHIAWLLCGLLVLIIVRMVLIHSDVTDFPLDRNLSTASFISRLCHPDTAARLAAAQTRFTAWLRQPETPEFPFIPLAACALSRLGLPPVAAGRLVGLLAAVLTGVGLVILGSRLHSRAAGVAALWLYALLPFSIFIGRSLLPDTLMMAALTWSLVEAVAPATARRPRWARALLAALWLAAAALAKLPALVFAPVAALLLLERLGWRRPSSWLLALAAAAFAGLAAGAWYELWNPLAGLSRLSANTNNLLGSVRDLGGAHVAWVAMMRAVLALSLPGVFLALLGLIYAQRRPDRLPLTAWFMLALLFIPLTLGANTYWAYALVPPACLLGGLALVELGRTFPVPLAAVLLGLLWLCPSLPQIREYLTLHPEYACLHAASVGVMTRPGEVAYLGKLSNDLQYFTDRKGDSIGGPTADPAKVVEALRRKPYTYVVSNQMDASPAVERLFATRPILAARQAEYVIFFNAASATLGEPVPGPEDVSCRTTSTTLDLAGVLGLSDVKTSLTLGASGALLTLNVILEKGPQYKESPNLTVEFIHEPSKTAFPLAPLRGGLVLSSWEAPLLQTPDFATSPSQRIKYHFSIPEGMPAGTYMPQFKLLLDRTRPVVIGQPQSAPQAAFTLAPRPAGPAPLPLTLNLPLQFWRDPNFRTEVTWTGQRRELAMLSSRGQLRLSPALAPGQYELTIVARALPAGASPREMWPILSIRQPLQGQASQWFPLKSESFRTYKVRFKWTGPHDFLSLSIGNPSIDTTPGRPFALYLDDCARGNRSIAIHKIWIDKVKDKGAP